MARQQNQYEITVDESVLKRAALEMVECSTDRNFLIQLGTYALEAALNNGASLESINRVFVSHAPSTSKLVLTEVERKLRKPRAQAFSGEDDLVG